MVNMMVNMVNMVNFNMVIISWLTMIENGVLISLSLLTINDHG